MQVQPGAYEGDILIPSGSSSSTTYDKAPVVWDTTQDQIDEIDAGDVVVGTNQNDQVEPIPDIPVVENEEPIRKRIVKIVDGKIVDSRIVYMRKQVISTSKGAGYVFLLPVNDPLSLTIEFTPMRIYLP